MQIQKIILLVTLLSITLFSQKIVLKTSFSSFNFTNSNKKDYGNRVGIGVDYYKNSNIFQIYYDKSLTQTYKPPLIEDLQIDKVYLKATHKFNNFQSLNFSYITISDNIIDETDGGNIYGVGYSYKSFQIKQYISDYKKFDVYQTDLSYEFKNKFNNFKTAIKIDAKYIYLKDKNSNKLSSNAEDDYLTIGLKAKIIYPEFYIGIGGYFGDRLFAVMNDGLAVQHHAMEFHQTYSAMIGKKWDKFEMKLILSHLEAIELPTMMDNIEVDNISLQINYSF